MWSKCESDNAWKRSNSNRHSLNAKSVQNVDNLTSNIKVPLIDKPSQGIVFQEDTENYAHGTKTDACVHIDHVNIVLLFSYAENRVKQYIRTLSYLLPIVVTTGKPTTHIAIIILWNFCEMLNRYITFLQLWTIFFQKREPRDLQKLADLQNTKTCYGLKWRQDTKNIKNHTSKSRKYQSREKKV